MKLYATVASERATKGQGGKYLDIVVQNESKRIVARLEVRTTVTGKTMLFLCHDKGATIATLSPLDWMKIGKETKGEKQKGNI